jgi:hypothetical protein
MAFVTGDVVPSDDKEFPFKVVFKKGETVIAEWPVESKQAGEEEIVELVSNLVEEDDDEDDDDKGGRRRD